ncbi:MAG: 4a-hydroxytetrahydrobiopterin dehydratase [Dehalococcoidia bacterium]
MPRKFTAGEVATALVGAPGWQTGDDQIVREFTFAGHIEAVGFVVRVAMAAEVMDHHPDLRIVYNRVEVRLSSHDAGGITGRDIALAKRINELL